MRIHQSHLKAGSGLALLLLLALPCQAAEFDATLQWSKRVDLGVPLSGVVQAVYADVGQRVAKGEKLLQIDDTVFKVKLKEARSTYKSQVEIYKEAEREKNRSQDLYDRTVLSDHELQVAKNNEVKAAAERDEAEAALVKARQVLKYSTLRAPFNALVLERNAQVGKVIAARLKPETLFVVADADKMLARIHVSETQLAMFKLGQSARVMLGSEKFDGVIRAIGFEPSGSAGNYPVDIEFSPGTHVLRAGQHGKVQLP